MSSAWYAVDNVEEIPSPALLIYPKQIEENIRRMIGIVGDVARLRPHIKTHKLAEVVHLQMAQGIRKFKTATIAESEMVAGCGATDILLAYQPVGPNVQRLRRLTQRFPATKFSATADDPGTLKVLSKAFADAGLVLEVWLDIDCGMHRTGVAPGPASLALRDLVSTLPGLRFAGLHAYDGHIHDSDLSARTTRCDEAFAPILSLRTQLAEKSGSPTPLIAGGTPTFPIHARRPDVECSPGTCLLWDAGYAAKLPDLDFLPAALVMTRVVSKPGGNRLCLDLGHKAIASENPPPRVQLLGVADARALMHSEEHLVIESDAAAQYAVGDCLYGIPWHICPTVALHSEVVVIREGCAVARWQVSARQRSLSV